MALSPLVMGDRVTMSKLLSTRHSLIDALNYNAIEDFLVKNDVSIALKYMLASELVRLKYYMAPSPLVMGDRVTMSKLLSTRLSLINALNYNAIEDFLMKNDVSIALQYMLASELVTMI
jgi:hypothetical protein